MKKLLFSIIILGSSMGIYSHSFAVPMAQRMLISPNVFIQTIAQDNGNLVATFLCEGYQHSLTLSAQQPEADISKAVQCGKAEVSGILRYTKPTQFNAGRVWLDAKIEGPPTRKFNGVVANIPFPY